MAKKSAKGSKSVKASKPAKITSASKRTKGELFGLLGEHKARLAVDNCPEYAITLAD